MTITHRRLPLDELMPFPGNARRGDVPKILESLRANGQYRELVVRDLPDQNIVLAGNHTFQALVLHTETLGDCTDECALCAQGDPNEAECGLIVCDDERAKRINLVDNKLGDDAVYDDAALAALLADLDDLDGTGYTADEADTLVAPFEEPEYTPFEEPGTAELNDDGEAMREQRVAATGGEQDRTLEARGVRDVILALPNAQADELAGLITVLRTQWPQASQGEVLLKAARIAVEVQRLGDKALPLVDEILGKAEPEASA